MIDWCLTQMLAIFQLYRGMFVLHVHSKLNIKAQKAYTFFSKI